MSNPQHCEPDRAVPRCLDGVHEKPALRRLVTSADLQPEDSGPDKGTELAEGGLVWDDGAEFDGDVPKVAAGGPTISDMIDAGLLSTGKDNVSVAYKGMVTTADLLPDGSIQYGGVQD